MSRGPWKAKPGARPAKERIEPAKPEPEVPVVKETAPSEEISATDALAAQMAQFMQLMSASQKDMSAQIARLSKKVAEDRVETRDEVRQPARQKARDSGITSAVGRDGEIVTRRAQFAATNPFDLPEEFVTATLDEGYTLEWKTRFVYNEERGVYISRLQRDGGWRPVMNGRLPNIFSGEDDEAVQHDGMILMERRVELTNAARREEQYSAREQLLMRQRNWGVESKRGDYFDVNHPQAQKDTLLRAVREQSDPSWAPSHTIASDSEF